MNSIALIDIMTPNNTQVISKNNLFVDVKDNDYDFLDILIKAFFSSSKFEEESMKNIEGIGESDNSGVLLSEILLQFLSQKNQGLSVNLHDLNTTKETSTNDNKLLEDKSNVENNENEVSFEKKAIQHLLPLIINALLKNISINEKVNENKDIDELELDQKNLIEKLLKDEPIVFQGHINVSKNQTETTKKGFIKEPSQKEIVVKEQSYKENVIKEMLIPNEFKSAQVSELNLNNLSYPIINPFNQTHLGLELDQKNLIEKPLEDEPIVFQGHINVSKNQTETTKKGFIKEPSQKEIVVKEQLYREIDVEDMFFNQNAIQKDLDLKYIERARPEMDKASNELKIFSETQTFKSFKSGLENEDTFNEFVFKTEEGKFVEKKQKNTPEEEKVIENLNNQHSVYKTIEIKGNDISNVKSLEMTEKIEKIIEEFYQEKKTSDMMIKVRIDEKDILHVALKKEGSNIVVNIKSTSLDMINMFNAQKDTIIKGLEEKNISVSIFVYPDGKNDREKRQTHEEGKRQYRKKDKSGEFYEVLMTQKV